MGFFPFVLICHEYPSFCTQLQDEGASPLPKLHLRTENVMHVEVLLLCVQIFVESLFGSFDDSKSEFVCLLL